MMIVPNAALLACQLKKFPTKHCVGVLNVLKLGLKI